MKTKLIIVGILLFGFVFQACEINSAKKYDQKFVVTYAELSLLYEKEKMQAKISDSLYQTKVADFFTKKRMSENDFRAQSKELMDDYKMWKLFLADVSRAVDSIKTINN